MKISEIKKAYICLFISLFLLFTGCDSQIQQDATQQPASQKTVEVTVEGNEKLQPEIEELLKDFAFTYGNILTTLENQNFYSFFADENQQNVYEKTMERYLDYYGISTDAIHMNSHKNQAAYDTLVAIRKLSGRNLAADSRTVRYSVEAADSVGDVVVVHIKEENVQQFPFMSRPSLSANINHWFALRNTGDSWKIICHVQEEDFFLLALEAWVNTAGENPKARAEQTVEILVADAQENIAELAEKEYGIPSNKDADGVYNRDAAVEYAQKWWNGRNHEAGYLAYDLYGGNCQNFASQCIYAGGIPMDCSGYGEHQWKFYSKTLNTRQTEYGRSYSWTGVDPFYTYAEKNRQGMICSTDMRPEYAQKGDVVQVGAYGRWRHSLVVTDVLYDDNGDFVDIAVASNTADRWNYPLGAYIYTYPRLIHITGTTQ